MGTIPPLASLRVIALESLQHGDPEASEELRLAATGHGFFYLDLGVQSNPIQKSNGTLLHSVETMFTLSRSLYSLPVEERLTYDIDLVGPHKLNGYKPSGRNEGIARNKKDGFEAFLVSKVLQHRASKTYDLKVSRDDVCNTPDHRSLALPLVLTEGKGEMKSFMQECHEVGQTILNRLATALDFPKNHIMRHSHRPEKPSTSALGMLKYSSLDADKSELGHGAHTDVGTLTLLFCTDRGLQLLDPSDNIWKFVELKPSCAVVNIGDSAHFMADSRIKSCLHRVVPYPGTEVVDRHSLAYFMRPEMDAVFQVSEEKSCRSIDWHDRKYSVFRSSIQEQKNDSVLTGRLGYVGLWEGERVGV